MHVCSSQNVLNDVCSVAYRKLVHCFHCSFLYPGSSGQCREWERSNRLQGCLDYFSWKAGFGLEWWRCMPLECLHPLHCTSHHRSHHVGADYPGYMTQWTSWKCWCWVATEARRVRTTEKDRSALSCLVFQSIFIPSWLSETWVTYWKHSLSWKWLACGCMSGCVSK